MDIALSRGLRQESISHRLDKIIQKIEERKYAKVLQKVRQVVKKAKVTRAALVERVNADVGGGGVRPRRWRCCRGPSTPCPAKSGYGPRMPFLIEILYILMLTL